MFEEGQEVTYTGRGGFPFQIENANRHLEIGHSYTIDYIFEDDWGYYLYFIEVPNKSFNPKMFVAGKQNIRLTPAQKESNLKVSAIKRDLPKEPTSK